MKKRACTLEQQEIIRARRQLKKIKRKANCPESQKLFASGIGCKVTVYHKGKIYPAISIGGKIGEVPKILSFRQNPNETIAFFNFVRDRLLNPEANWLLRKQRGNRLARIGKFYDFSTVEYISTSCALVLSAEYQRAWRGNKNSPPLINLHLWNTEVRKRLFEIGFFDILGVRERYFHTDLEDLSEKAVKTLKFIDGENSAELEEVDRQLLALAEYIYPGETLDEGLSAVLNSAISEAMVNVRQHAYDPSHSFQYPHINKYWFAGAADKSSRTISISMFDQGATIPVTYPRAKIADRIMAHLKMLANLTGLEEPSDGAYILTAVKYGNSQVDQPHRGKGLPQIKDAIDHCKNGTLMIMSRNGKYEYSYGNDEKHQAYSGSIGGTLITWNVELPAPNSSKLS